MKGIVQLTVLLASIASVICRPQFTSKYSDIIEQNNNFNGIDPWKWSFLTIGGISRMEEGSLLDGILEVSGSYSWTAPDNTIITVTYHAGKDGYTAQTKTESWEKHRVMYLPPSYEAAPADLEHLSRPTEISSRKPGQPQELGVNTQLSLIG